VSDEVQPIVIRRVYKRGRHHGGSWKVAFADFATALMAFFLLMWLMGNASKEQQRGIAEYFQNPAGVQGPGGESVSAIKLGGAMDGPAAPKLAGPPATPTLPRGLSPNAENASAAASQAQPKASDSAAAATSSDQTEQQRLNELLQLIREAVGRSQSLEPYKDQLLLDITPQGLRIQIVDHKNQSMFDVGSARLRDYSSKILEELGAMINSVPNKVSITGHTDSRSYQRPDYSNWELSTDRANAARRALLRGGMQPEKVAQVVGFGSSVLFDKQDPLSAVNRRISIVVLTHEAEQQIGEDTPPIALQAVNQDDSKAHETASKN
jgi:chemotaxis protein MotB